MFARGYSDPSHQESTTHDIIKISQGRHSRVSLTLLVGVVSKTLFT